MQCCIMFDVGPNNECACVDRLLSFAFMYDLTKIQKSEKASGVMFML